jgi:lipoprotein-releasing system permease protein
VAVITAALVILLSAFNGMETMIQSIYSEFDSDISVTPSKGKTFNENQIDWVSTCLAHNHFTLNG